MPTSTKMRLNQEASYILKELDKAAETAMFYGFRPVKTPKIEKADHDQVKSSVTFSDPAYIETAKSAFPRPEEKFSLLRTLMEWELHNENTPLMIHYKRPVSQLSLKRIPDERHYSLDIVGSTDSISEAIAIRTAMAILADHGYTNTIVDINSIGDKHSIAQFEKELINFTRKHGGDSPSEVRQQIKKDPFDVWRCEHKEWLDIRKRAPQSLSYLSEQSVNHFQEVLEHLETMDIPYRINPTLIGHRHYCSHTIFEIKSAPVTVDTQEKVQDVSNTSAMPAGSISTNTTAANTTSTPPATPEDETFAVGTRHNYLARRIGFKRETPVMSVNLRFKKPSFVPKMFFKKKPDPKFFFIQFGTMAKLKSLPIIESLRQARIPVHHMLTSDKFVAQMSAADASRVPYVIILGQKEALENSVVVRNVSDRSQNTVPIPNLANFLTRLI